MLDKHSAEDVFHRQLSDEVLYFYMGDPLTVVELNENASGQVIETILGNDFLAGHSITHPIKRNTWFTTRLDKGSPCGWSLVGATVSPGFDIADFELGTRKELLTYFPAASDTIVRHTPL